MVSGNGALPWKHDALFFPLPQRLIWEETGRAEWVLSLDHIRKQLRRWTTPGWISVTFKPFLLRLMVEKQLTFDPVHAKWQVWLSLVLIWTIGRHSTMKLDWGVYHERERNRSYQRGSLCFPEESSPFLWWYVNWEHLRSHVSISFKVFILRPPDSRVHAWRGHRQPASPPTNETEVTTLTPEKVTDIIQDSRQEVHNVHNQALSSNLFFLALHSSWSSHLEKKKQKKNAFSSIYLFILSKISVGSFFSFWNSTPPHPPTKQHSHHTLFELLSTPESFFFFSCSFCVYVHVLQQRQ